MFMQKLRKDKRGLSLVELVCAIAILAIITMTVGGAMVFASNSYRQGTVDTALQQEAQFTANAIESLIIDATKTVDFAGGVLTITNTDYTYIIRYDAVEKTLRYTQHVTGNSDDKVADNELLAEHVVSFNVDASNFETSRNVVLEIGLENGESVFTTNYNVTSRNDASAGDAPEVFAQINCDSLIIMEPNQYYELDVQVLGSSDTTYGVSVEGAESGDTTATVTSTGVRIELGATETGGDDAEFRLRLSTNVTDGEGNPFTKLVTVKVRRTTAVSFSSLELVSGDAFKAGAKYRVTATPTGSNLEEVFGASFDSTPYQYINPYTIQWSFTMSDGSAVADWMEVGSTGTEDNTVEVILKQDLPIGKAIKLKATALHSRGVLRGSAYTNKGATQKGAETYYDNVYDEVQIVKSVGDSLFLRGDDFQVPIARTLNDIIKEDLEKQGKDYDPNVDMVNGSYTGNHHIRYTTIDSGERHSSKNLGHGGYDYPYLKKMAFQGFDEEAIWFNAVDMADMYYMRTYKLDLVYSFTWQDMNNNTRVYPDGFSAETCNLDDPDIYEKYAHCVYSWIIDPVGVVFGSSKVDSSTPVNLQTEGYTTASGMGIGTVTNPLPLIQSHNVQITYTNIGPAPNDQAGVFNMLSSGARAYKWNNGTWTLINNGNKIQVQNHFDGNSKQSGTLVFGTVNGFQAGNSNIYKLVFEEIPYSYDDNGTTIQRNEPYADESTGRGVIIFQIP